MNGTYTFLSKDAAIEISNTTDRFILLLTPLLLAQVHFNFNPTQIKKMQIVSFNSCI